LSSRRNEGVNLGGWLVTKETFLSRCRSLELDDARRTRRRRSRAIRFGLRVDRPSWRPLAAVDASQEDCARLAPHAVLV